MSLVKQRKVLVADDDRITREIIGGILTRAGYEVVFAEDGKSAVEKASTEKPDLVFIDGLMPKMHGFLACKAIKELDRQKSSCSPASTPNRLISGKPREPLARMIC